MISFIGAGARAGAEKRMILGGGRWRGRLSAARVNFLLGMREGLFSLGFYRVVLTSARQSLFTLD